MPCSENSRTHLPPETPAREEDTVGSLPMLLVASLLACGWLAPWVRHHSSAIVSVPRSATPALLAESEDRNRAVSNQRHALQLYGSGSHKVPHWAADAVNRLKVKVS